MPIREARLLLLGRLGLAFWLFWMVFSRVDTMGERGVYIDHGMSGLPYLFRTALVAKVYFSSESIKSPSMSNRHARTGGKLDRFLRQIFFNGRQGFAYSFFGAVIFAMFG